MNELDFNTGVIDYSEKKPQIKN